MLTGGGRDVPAAVRIGGTLTTAGVAGTLLDVQLDHSPVTRHVQPLPLHHHQHTHTHTHTHDPTQYDRAIISGVARVLGARSGELRPPRFSLGGGA